MGTLEVSGGFRGLNRFKGFRGCSGLYFMVETLILILPVLNALIFTRALQSEHRCPLHFSGGKLRHREAVLAQSPQLAHGSAGI